MKKYDHTGLGTQCPASSGIHEMGISPKGSRLPALSLIATVKSMFRFHDALNPSIHLAGLPFPSRKGQTCQAGTEESEHIFDNSYRVLGEKKGRISREGSQGIMISSS